MEYPSALAFLMEQLNITVKELSSALSVDYSLVSKWRRNTRPLTKKNIHIKNLVNFLMEREHKLDEDKLHHLLKIYNPQIDLESYGDVEENLFLWLTGSFSPLLQEEKLNKIKGNLSRGEYTSQFNVFRGNEGRREAVLQFMDYILDLGEKQDLLLFSQEELSWMAEDREFLQVWQSKLMEILRRGHGITIIHWIDRDVESLAKVIKEWLPLYFVGGLRSFYYPKYNESIFKSTLFVLENHLAVFGLQGDRKESRYTALYYDKQTTNQYSWMFYNLLKECKPLVETIVIGKKDNLIEKFKGTELLSHPSYMVSNYPPISFLPEKVFRRILEENHLDLEEKERCLEYYYTLSNIVHPKGRAKRRHIYSKRAIEIMLIGGRIEYSDLSAIVEKEIQVPPIVFREHLKALVSALEKDENFDIVLMPGEIFKINLFVKEDDYIFAWQGENASKIVVAEEPTVVSTFFRQYQDLWQQTSRISKEKDEVIEKIKSILDSGERA